MGSTMKEAAKQIATHIINEDLNVASDMFSREIVGLKHFEAVALKDMIHRYVDGYKEHGKDIWDMV